LDELQRFGGEGGVGGLWVSVGGRYALLHETLETNLIPKTCAMTASRCTAEVELTLTHDTRFNHGPRGMESR